MAPITGYRDGGERYLDPVTAKRRIGDPALHAGLWKQGENVAQLRQACDAGWLDDASLLAADALAAGV
jgi:hypothetical protein